MPTMSLPAFASSVSVDTDSVRAFTAAAEALARQMPRPDWLMAFASAQHFGFLESHPTWLADRFGTDQVLGCTAESVIHGAREYLRPE